VNIFRRLPLYRLLLLCGVLIAVAASATALAFALGSGPTPPPRPLAVAVHDALAAPPVEGVTASVKLTNRLLEGASLASGGGERGELASNPLLSGASGRLWIAKDGRMRLELQAEKGDTQIFYDGQTVELYDAATNTLYRYTPPARDAAASAGAARRGQRLTASVGSPGERRVDTKSLNRAIAELRKRARTAGLPTKALRAGNPQIHVFAGTQPHEVPSVAKIEEAIAHLSEHATVSGATPSDVAGRAAYTVRVSPQEGGSLLGGAELSFDAATGIPLRSAIYSASDPTPVIELAASDISYGPVADSVFAFTPPAGAKIVAVKPPSADAARRAHEQASRAGDPKLTSHGHGVTAIAVLESPSKGEAQDTTTLEGLPQVKINGVDASELRTELGTLLSFERSGVRYVLAGSVTPEALEAFARGL
jgi:outer membrane lipoprotein-sorting protein